MHPNFIGEVEPGSKEDELLSSLDRERMPRHIAVIMDGNGRWAKQRGRPRIFGHRAGAESVRAIVDTCARLEITAVTLYAFSTENWKRPKSEVSGLMQMLKRFLRSELEAVRKNNIRFQAIGKISGLGEDVQREIASAIDKTAANSGTVLSVALNYGGRAEIVDACIKAARALLKDGRDIKSLAETDIESNLYTHGLPDVDLLIRTSGEMRISNFLLWQLAYSEIYVTPTLFPDFRRRDLFEAIREFQHRDRRFGDIRSNSTAAEHRR